MTDIKYWIPILNWFFIFKEWRDYRAKMKAGASMLPDNVPVGVSKEFIHLIALDCTLALFLHTLEAIISNLALILATFILGIILS